MKKRKTAKMGFWCVLFSAFFLFNPIVGFIDVLPDFFGYLLLYVGLYKMADMNVHIEEARAKLRILLWVGIGQAFAMWFIYTMIGGSAEANPYEQPTAILLCSFALLFFEWYFLIAAFRDMLRGFERLAEKHASVRLDHVRRGKSKSMRMYGYCKLFLIIAPLASLLPELTILTSFEYAVHNKRFPFDWYEYIELFRVIGGFIGLLVGVVWLILFLSYVRAALRDREWLLRLESDYSGTVCTQTGMLTVRRFHLCFLLLQIAVIFAINLRLSYYTALPGAVLAALACLAVYLLSVRVHVRQKKSLYWAGALLFAVSAAQGISNYLYLGKYLPESSLYYPEAYYKYLAIRFLGMAEAVCTLLFIWILMKILLELIFEHTSVEYDGDVTHALSNAATGRLHRGFERRGTAALVFFALAAIGNFLDAYFFLEYPWGWAICFVLSFIGISIVYAILHEFSVQLRYRYQTTEANKKH